jgi:hypothetical protein
MIDVSMTSDIDFRKLESDMIAKIKEAYNRAAELTKDSVASEAPVDTGKLRDSHYVEGDFKDGFHIRSDIPYAWIQDKHTSYVETGLSKAEQKVKAIFENALRGS